MFCLSFPIAFVNSPIRSAGALPPGRILGDCEAVLPTLAADIFDAIVTDPPYHLERGGVGVPGDSMLTGAA